jgi:trehalose 6-phosphate synthase/phosphatase
MNLVAKEYCASRFDDRGVLVLSELAGAATELREAVLVNPFDLASMVSAIDRALAMTESEQGARMRALRATVAGNDVEHWAGSFLADLARATPAVPTAIDAGGTLSGAVRTVREAPRRLLMLDYDGTLVPYAAMPDLAFPDQDLRALLAELAARPGWNVHVLCGRRRESLEAWLGDVPIGLHAEHGVWSRWPGEPWTSHVATPSPGLAAVEATIADAVRRTPGTLLERKVASLAWHYRMAEPLLATRRLADLRRRLAVHLTPELSILDAVNVLEVRTRGADKGVAAARIVERIRGAGVGELAILAVGDDRTDEDMFSNLPATAFTVRVGGGATVARHRVDTPDDVRGLLRGLL